VRYSAFNITTAVLLALTVWLIIARFRIRTDSNWPLIYYGILVAYHQFYPGRLNPYVILTVVMTALLIRFEFLGGWIRYVLRALELGVLVYLIYTLVSLMTL
jgi:hypothetical protein